MKNARIAISAFSILICLGSIQANASPSIQFCDGINKLETETTFSGYVDTEFRKSVDQLGGFRPFTYSGSLISTTFALKEISIQFSNLLSEGDRFASATSENYSCGSTHCEMVRLKTEAGLWVGVFM